MGGETRSPTVASASAEVPEERHRGRPRRPTADEAVLRATIESLADAGLDGTTIRAISERSGVARASIYLRWPSRDAVIAAALRSAIGREPFPLTGDIARDLRAGMAQVRDILAEPMFVAVLPALIRAVLPGAAGPEGASISYDSLFPGRLRFANEYRDLAAEQGFRTDVDASTVVDLTIGSPWSYLLATGRPLSDRALDESAAVILAGLRENPGG
jgi:AcrR family transcriptional regulator